MKRKRRRITKYKPRPRTHTTELQKQQLKDYEHLINLDLGSLLVLNEEGTDKQKKQAREQLLSHIRKYKGDMEKLAKGIGTEMSDTTQEFIKSILVLLQETEEIDPAKIRNHHKIAELLEEKIKRKAG